VLTILFFVVLFGVGAASVATLMEQLTPR